MDLLTIITVLAGAVAGGFVNGLSGFGNGLFALPVWLAVLTPVQAIPMVAAMSVASGAQSLWHTRHELSDGYAVLPWFLIPAFIGLAFGLNFLSQVTADGLRLLIASLMIAYGLFLCARRNLPHLSREIPWANALVGLIGGILGGAVSLSGPVPTMWCAIQPWDKKKTSAVLRPFNVTVLTLAIVLFALAGRYTIDVITLTLIAFPGTMIGSRIGIALYRRLNDALYKRIVIVLMLVSGISVAVRILL